MSPQPVSSPHNIIWMSKLPGDFLEDLAPRSLRLAEVLVRPGPKSLGGLRGRAGDTGGVALVLARLGPVSGSPGGEEDSLCWLCRLGGSLRDRVTGE